MSKPIVALIYDFDKTLSPKDMQEYGYLPGIGMEPDPFWALCADFSRENQTDNVLTYMYMMKKMAGNKVDLSQNKLREMGSGIEFFPGVETWFDRINRIGEECGVIVEHYIISTGLTEIIKGSRIGEKFKAIYASSFCYDEKGQPIWPSMAVNYTNKTQYLFRINKGVFDVTNSRDLNAYMPEYQRRVPFTNMIYFGDGPTDVPCMKMTKQKGGYSIVVHKPGETDMADDMLLQGRVDFSFEADYSQGGEMERTVAMLMKRILATHELSQKHASQMKRAAERRGSQPLNVDVRGGLTEETPE